jgi:opacity protein-like surface antigen
MNGVQTKIDTQLRGIHLDLNVYYPLSDCWDIVGSMGAGVIKPKITLSVLSNTLPKTNPTLSNTPGLFPNDAIALASTKGKTKTVFRIGLGSQYMLSEAVGIRANLRWESTTSLRVDGNYQFQQSSLNTTGLRKIFINTASLSVGVSYKFY